jgi:hypothetical protein
MSCSNCVALQRQLTAEWHKRVILEAGLDQIRFFGERELDPHNDRKQVQPRSRLARVLVTRVEFLLEMVRS